MPRGSCVRPVRNLSWRLDGIARRGHVQTWPTRGPSRVSARRLRVPRRGGCSRLKLGCSSDRPSAVVHALRVRPNQALQRTGSVCGFTVRSLFQARRRFGRPLNASSLGRGQSGLIFLVRPPPRPSADCRGFPPIGPTVRGAVARFGSAASPPSGVVAARSAAVCLAAPARPPSRRARRPPRRGLTRRCSGPAVCAGLHCSPGSSPSSVWPAAERFFVRPLAATP